MRRGRGRATRAARSQVPRRRGRRGARAQGRAGVGGGRACGRRFRRRRGAPRVLTHTAPRRRSVGELRGEELRTAELREIVLRSACIRVVSSERHAKQKFDSMPSARPAREKPGCAPQARAAPTSSVASAPPAASESAPPRPPQRRTRPNEKSGSRPRTVSANDAASRPIARLSVRKPSVYAHAIRDTSTSEPGGSGRSRPVAAASAAWNDAAAVNCIAAQREAAAPRLEQP